MTGLGDLVNQAKQLQARMARLQEELGQRVVEATAGGGMVSVAVNGRQEVIKIAIEPEVVNPQEIDLLQDLLLAAVNEGLHRSKEMVKAEMSKLTGGISIPGIF